MTASNASRRGDQAPPATVFLQAPVPGVTPYCGGRHLWGRSLELLRTRRSICMDLPGCGDVDLGDSVPTVDAMATHVAERIRAEGLGQVQMVGHDVGALVALVLAMDHPGLLSGATLIASAWAAPSGDGVESYTLRHPPLPMWSADSQRWALERLSFSHLHVDEELVAQCVRAAERPAHRSAVTAMAGDGYARTFSASAMRAKFRFFQLARGAGLQVPLQVIAGMQDPQVSTAHMLSLFRIAAARQPRAQFHILNRSGAFPFREQPEDFMRIVQAFADGLAQESAAAGAQAA